MPSPFGQARTRAYDVYTLDARIKRIAKLVHDDVWDPVRGPQLRQWAGVAVKPCPNRGDAGEEAADRCELVALHAFIVDNVRYTGDLYDLQTQQQIDVYQSPVRTMEIGAGDCFPQGTLLLRDDYRLVPVEQIKVGDRIWGYDKWTTVKAAWCKGVLPLDAMRLNNGNWVRLTPDHKVYVERCERHGTMRKGVCTKECHAEVQRIHVSEVEEEDVLLQPKTIPFGEEGFDPERAYIEGLYISDGWSDERRFSISGQDGCPKEAQKREVEDICRRLGLRTRWHRKYITVNDKEWTSARMALMGRHAPQKHALSIGLNEAAARELLRGIMADSGDNHSGGRTFTTTSRELALQTRLLHRMAGVTCGWSYIENHGGLGQNPIYRLSVRKAETMKHPKRLRVNEIARNVDTDLVFDITTEDHYVYLPEADVTVSNCDCMAGLDVALLSFLGWTAWLRVISQDGSSWSHIYPVAGWPKNEPTRGLAFDTTLGHNKLGVEVPYRVKRDFFRPQSIRD